ncbi:chemotaxis protein CheD [Rhodanobacter sp. ANJX3]|uniref:chemotaxis protein CheD n=1 Tax=Rhodanobacter sp. ANJX3 TaxID=2723083 RepID=UPI00161BEC3D|nr:chemotaxis protein CheD [Rhodanobacter sp. ANJX3]MBB5356931.1 chemotaxis protein CheD [Rhodanobacter sp. ANJX3]
MIGEDVHVKMCEVRSGSAPQVLRSTLGSCVGIGLLWRERDLYALAHCLLPESAVRAEQLSAKYVTDAIPSLLRLIGAEPSHYHQLEAVIAGGAYMMHHLRPALYGMIGELNTRMAQRLLAEAGIRVVHTDIGGTSGRQLSIHCETRQYVVRTFERIN